MEQEKINKKMEKSDERVYIMDIRYKDSYNPEAVPDKKRHYRYIVDADGKEKLIVYEEINEDKENERQ